MIINVNYTLPYLRYSQNFSLIIISKKLFINLIFNAIYLSLIEEVTCTCIVYFFFFSYRRKTDEVFGRLIQNTLTVKISSVKKFHQLKVTKYFKDFVTFQRQNFLTAFSDREQKNSYL